MVRKDFIQEQGLKEWVKFRVVKKKVGVQGQARQEYIFTEWV